MESYANLRCETEDFGFNSPSVKELSLISSNENSFEGDSADLLSSLVANEKINYVSNEGARPFTAFNDQNALNGIKLAILNPVHKQKLSTANPFPP